MVLAIYKYLNVLLDKLISKIYGFMGLTYELKMLREDIQTTETALNTYKRANFILKLHLISVMSLKKGTWGTNKSLKAACPHFAKPTKLYDLCG